MAAGLKTLPGTAAEILDDEVRAVLCADKVNTEEWLDAHRTGLGALPEKVLDDGSPAAVAPLAWTAAVTVLTTRSLDRALPIPPV